VKLTPDQKLRLNTIAKQMLRNAMSYRRMTSAYAAAEAAEEKAYQACEAVTTDTVRVEAAHAALALGAAIRTRKSIADKRWDSAQDRRVQRERIRLDTALADLAQLLIDGGK
jgi:hypothetical protein